MNEERVAWNKGLKGVQKSPFKNKTFEEIYDINKAKEIKLKSSKSHLGQICWMTKKENRIKAIEHGKKLGLSNLGRKMSVETKKKISLSTLGKKLSKETRTKISNNKKGKSSFFKGKTYEEIYGQGKAKEILEIKKSYIASRETRTKISNNKKGKSSFFKGKTYEEIYGKERAKQEIKKRFSKILSKVCKRPNNFEISCGTYLDYLFPGRFKYCGDGSIFINGRYPDFISEDLKIVVLCNGLYWHLLRFGLKETLENYRLIELKESKSYIESGYEVWFIWENKINKQMEVNKWKKNLS